MLESVIAYILRNYLGEYLENVATDQLSFLLLSGSVEIDNLPVRTDGIRKLGLPIEIKAGFVKKLKLKIPMRALKSQPWEIVVQGLYVIVEPSELGKIDEKDEAEFEMANKMKRLQKMEEKWKEEQKQKSSDGSWTSKLFATILENLQVSIEQVHIRYEERLSAAWPYSLGLRIGKLAAHSTDGNWEQNFATNRAKSWKLVELTNLEVYTDNISHHHLSFQPLEIPLILDALGNISNNLYVGPAYCFNQNNKYTCSNLLQPVTCTAKVIRNRNPQPLQHDDGPRYRLYIELPNVKLSLGKTQYKSLISTGDAFDMYYRSKAVRKWRPEAPVIGHAKLWWQFAFKVHLTRIAERNRRKTWKYIISRLSILLFYTQAYRQHIEGSVKLSWTKQSQLTEIENELPFDEISIMRRIAMAKVEENLSIIDVNTNASGGNYTSYWSSWLPMGWGTNSSPTLDATPSSPAEANDISSDFLSNFSPSEFEEELDDFLELDTQTSNSFLFRDHQFASVCFSMQEGSLSLSDPSNSTPGIIDINFNHLKLQIDIRPRINYFRFDLSLSSIQIRDKHHSKSFFPVLVEPIRDRHSPNDELFSLCVVKRKSKKFADLSISGRSQPLEVICNMDIVSLLQDFFKLPYMPSGSNLEANLTLILRDKIAALKSYTVKELRPVIAEALQEERWWSSKHLNLDLEISAPCFVMPEDFCLQESRTVIIDLGLFSLKTMDANASAQAVTPSLDADNASEDDDFGTPTGSLTPKEKTVTISPTNSNSVETFEDYIKKTLLHKLYDRYQLDIKNLQILVTDNFNSESWKTAYKQSSTPLHVLDKLTVSLQLCRRLRFTCDPSESNIAVTGALPRLDIHIDEEKFNTILHIQEKFLRTILNTSNDSIAKPEPVKPAPVRDIPPSTPSTMNSSILWLEEQNYWNVEKRQLLIETKLLDASFTFQEVTLSFSHRNRVITQLRVPGIQLNHMQRPYDYKQSLTIQDVFVADAIQRFGTQYDLLIYSQGKDKYYKEDNGNLVYVPSPSHCEQSTSVEMFYSVIQLPDSESKALLKLDREVIFQESPDSTFPCNAEVIKANFTSLNIIANQESLVEILAFFNSLQIQSYKDVPRDISQEAVNKLQSNLSQCRREISAKFNCLTAKFVCSEGLNGLKEVATIKGYGLKLETIIHDNYLDITGHLSGVSLDNIMESLPNQRVLCVGRLEQTTSEDNFETNAFNFKVLYQSDLRQVNLDFQLASVHYTHCSKFLASLQQCFSEFQYYISKARESLESAAKDMAYSLFHKGDFSELFPVDEKPLATQEDLKILYNILVHAPTVQLENQNNRKDRFVFNLGEITITNRSRNDLNPQFEHISIQVRNIYMLANIDDQYYRILENTNTKVEVIRKLDANLSMLECEQLKELTNSDLQVSAKAQLVMFAALNENIQVNLHKICFDSLKEILYQNSTANKTSLVTSNSNPLSNNSDQFRGNEGFETILFAAGCSVHNITLTISQDIGLETKNIVEFSTSNFSASVYQEDPYILTVDTKLGGVRGYDLLNDSTKKSFLVTSYLQDYSLHKDAFCPYSTLPEIISYQSPLRSYEVSLNESVLDVNTKKHDLTPLNMLDLVSTKITYVNPNHPEFSTLYQSMTTHANVVMNHIHVIVNLQTWVLLLDFFSLTPHNDNLVTTSTSQCREQVSSPVNSVPFNPLKSLNSPTAPSKLAGTFAPTYLPAPLPDPDEVEVEVLSIPLSVASSIGSEVPPVNKPSPKLSLLLDVSINSLIAVFNKSNYPLTCNSATGFKSCVKMERGDISVVGELGKASLIDLSPHGKFYRERFVTYGENALYFDFFKYGDSDPLLERELDMRAKFRMSSVRYVHTKRFLSENMAFCQHFFQLIDAFQRMKAKSIGNVSFSGPNRHPRVQIDVSAACPIIFIPCHWFSPYLFIGELGHVTVSNEFLFDGKKGTWSHRNRGDSSPYRTPEHSKSTLISPIDQKERNNIENAQYTGPCLLDVMKIELQGNDVFTALFDTEQGVFVREDSRILKEKLNYKVLFEHNLHMPMCHKVPNFRFEVYISDSHCMADKKQMDAFKTFLTKNLGETMEEFERPTSVIRDPIVFEDFEEKWVDISFCFIFQHVCLEFVSSRATHVDDLDQFLSRFYMHNTTLLIEIFSDSTKDIDFISRQMSIVDVRFDDYVESQKPSIYRKVLLPRNDFENDPSTSSLQVEVHVKLTPQSMEYTILLNNLRMIFMMDLALQCWSHVADWSEEHQYLFDSPEDNYSVNKSLTPRSPQTQKSRDLHIKVSVTETDFVIIEDLTSPDTQALVCKGTTVMTFTKNPTYGLSCNLSGVELFSCCLASEEETALSIIDPLLISIEIPRSHKLDHSYPLHIEVQNVNTRLSYNDMKLFAAIFNSISNILEVHNISSSSLENSENRSITNSINPTDSLSTDLDSYVIIEDTFKSKAKRTEEEKNEPSTFGEVSLQLHEFKLVLIDDCGNCDFPLGEINLDRMYIKQSLHAPFIGSAKIKLATNYFNRNVSAWEPFTETFRFSTDWKKENRFSRIKSVKGEEKVGYPHYSCTVLSEEILLLNLTSSLLEILTNTQASWGQDLSQVSEPQPLGIPTKANKRSGSATQLSSLAVRSISGFNFRKRNPFIPFRLENNTGLALKFATLTKNPYKFNQHSFVYDSSGHYAETELRGWIEVPIGNSVSFEFEKKSKIRHQHLQHKTVHMLVVQVEGWKQTKTPISADQVGIVFRNLKPDNSSYPSVKLIFSIKLDGAQKVINVRTPIAIKNELHFEMEIKLSGELPNQGSDEFSLKPDCYASVPLNRQLSELFIRPRGWGAQYPSHPLSLDRIDRSDLWRVCIPFGQKELKMPNHTFIYTYSVKDIQKDGAIGQSSTQNPFTFKTIILTHPFIIENLLPQEIAVEIADLNQTKAIKPGASIPIISFTPSRGFSFQLHLDNFQRSHIIRISPTYSESPTIQTETIRDEDNRALQLKIIVSVEKSPARKVTIMTEYWLINKSNLPLIFREDNCDFEAAGQFREHETARSLIPLPFSFIHSDASDAHCQVRLGKSQLLPVGIPTWSENFRLLSNGGVVPIYMQISPNSVPVEFQLAVDIVKGSGKYKDVTMVTFENRFQIENLTSLPIRYIQNCQFEDDAELISEFSYGIKQVISPNSVIPFNWPRLDRDHFLRVKYEDILGVYWSCPFKVVEEDNFVLSMRSREGNSHFVRVNIRQKNYAYIVRFSDTRNLPPPFIIENYSQVQIQYVQASLPPSYKHYIKPGNIKNYAWDEILSEQKLKLFVDDIDQSVVYDPTNYSEQPKLYYENFFYIALYDTFTNESTIQGRELVLSVDSHTKKVLFTRKSHHPAQLWRMTGSGKIEHVSSQKQGFNLVLDRADPGKSGAFSSTCMPLVLREHETRRDATQVWNFTDGLLTLDSLPYQCVCAKILPVSVDSCDAVLVSNPKFPRSLKDSLSLPSNHHIRILKCKPGSGMLSVRISTKGPSNIIRITDTNPIYHHLNINPLNWLLPSEHDPVTKILQEDETDNAPFEFVASCKLSKGIGLSLVSNREEITFSSFDSITAIYKRTNKLELIDFSVGNVQVDNQLFDSHSTAIFYVEQGVDNRKYAFSIEIERQFDSSPGFHLFKFLHIELQNYVLTIDERILLKLLQFFDVGQRNTSGKSSDITSSRSIENVSEIKYFYFRDIFINSTKLKTSMFTVSNLPPQLQATKTQLGLKLVKFQAPINLSEYQRRHTFYRLEEHIASIWNHYRGNLSGQALKVLGSVDFLGNPLGLFNDVTKGITGLITLRHGFAGLLKDVTHGLSDSASKITGSAGNLASYMTFDKQFQRDREEMVPVAATASITHLGAGLTSFASGMFGGFTSLVTSPYQGAQEGILGFMAGVGKGVAGTIAKPLAGTLDLVSSTSAALRAQTLSSSDNLDRRRLPRCCVGPGSALPLYTERSAKGLYYFNQFAEWESSLGSFVALEDVRHTSDEYIQVVISTGALYFINVHRKPRELNTNDVKLVVQLSRLQNIKIISKRLEYDPDTVCFVHHLELNVLYDDLTPKLYEIACHSQEVAMKLNQIIDYAKHLREEEKQVIPIASFEVYW